MKKEFAMKLSIAIKSLLVLSLALFFNACGGGGGGDTANIDNQSYTYNLKKFSDSHTSTTEFSGTVKVPEGTVNVTATHTSQYDGTETLENGNVIHRQSGTFIIESSNNSIISQSNSATFGGVPIYSYNQTTGVECFTTLEANETTPLPENATANYVSDITPLTCSDGTYKESLIRIVSTSGQYAQVEILTNGYTSHGGTLTHTEKDTYTIDPNLNISKIEIQLTDIINNIQYELKSTSVTNH